MPFMWQRLADRNFMTCQNSAPQTNRTTMPDPLTPPPPYTAADPMTWSQSIRAGGLVGRRISKGPIEPAIEALRRNIKGRRRHDAAEARVERWRSELSSKGRLSIQELGMLLSIPGLNRGSVPDSTLTFVDIELDAQGSISQVGLVTEISGRLVGAEGTSSDMAELTALLRDRVVVGHNAWLHDFPRLAKAGVELPSEQIDTLRWAWIAWPSLESHALGALVESAGVEGVAIGRLHDAVDDAMALALLWPNLVKALDAVTEHERAAIRGALKSVEPDAVLDRLLGAVRQMPPPVPRPQWQRDAGAPRAGNRVRSRRVVGSEAPGAVRVVSSLRRSVATDPAAGFVVRPSEVLDADKVEGLEPGWPKAIALRMMWSARGVLPLAPPSARAFLVGLGRSDTGALMVPGTPLLSDLATVSTIHVARPLVIDVSLASLFEPVNTGVVIEGLDLGGEALQDVVAADELSDVQREKLRQALRECAPADLAELVERDVNPILLPGSDTGLMWMTNAIDVGRHSHGAEVLLDGPVGGERSRAMWCRLLGEDVLIEGPTKQRVEWSTIEGLIRSSARYPGRRTAQLLGIAAGNEREGRSTLVVDASVQRRAIERNASRIWRELLQAPLLRPPGWPTVDEARRRLTSGSAKTALVGGATARELAGVADVVVMAKSPIPTLTHPTIRRLIGDDLGDPYAEVLEPISAHLTSEMMCSAKGTVFSIADPLLISGVLVDLCGSPTPRHLTEYLVDESVAESLVSDLRTHVSHRLASERAVASAARRLLPPGAELKAFQEVVISDVAAGKDVVAVFRTGLGKSLCYQVPALALAQVDGVTVVVSPLIALQRDQLRSLRRRGVAEAALYNSSLMPEVRRGILRGVEAGFYRLLFVSPEALAGHSLRQVLQGVDVSLFAIDEAHCISEMGHDFRPDYRTLPRAIARVLSLPDGAQRRASDDSGPSVVALTGTASPQVIDDIRELLS